jgi:hypothetical protein
LAGHLEGSLYRVIFIILRQFFKLFLLLELL